MNDSTDEIPGMDAVLAARRFNDTVVVGDRTQALLHERNLLPSEWGIPAAEQARIMTGNIKVGIVFPPASQLRLTTSPASRPQRIYVVALDLKALDTAGLSRRETLALILHEIGHIVNPYQPQQPLPAGETAPAYDATLLGEMYADDYARLCGFGNEIASSLQKCRGADPGAFQPDQVRLRVQRIADDVRNSITPPPGVPGYHTQ